MKINKDFFGKMNKIESSFPIPDKAQKNGCPPPMGRQIWYVDRNRHRHGPAFRWHPAGEILQSATQYHHGQRNGLFRQWYANGQLEIEGSFLNDLPEGSWKRYNEEGLLILECECTQGEIVGEATSYYPNGQCSRRWLNQKGKLHGASIIYDMSGQTLLKEHYQRGRREGLLKRWQVNILVERSHWKNGEQHGIYESFWWDGQPLEQGSYEQGLRDGPWKRYWYGGALAWVGGYRAGQRADLWKFWDVYGEAQAEAIYDEDHLVELISGEIPPDTSASLPVSQPMMEIPDFSGAFVRGAAIPTTMITGFLGAGKTTAIQQFLRHRPTGESWLVYINEYGEVGIDGASFAESNGLFVQELAGGCACCISNLPFVMGLERLLGQMRPDHLLIEPSGLADPMTLEQSIQKKLGSELDIRARICIVDPRKLEEQDYWGNPVYRRQLEYCDLLVANRCDLASPAQLGLFRELAQKLEVQAVLETMHGRIDPEWLTRISGEDLSGEAENDLHLHVTAKGFIFPNDLHFDRAQIEKILGEFLADKDFFPYGWLRAKGVFSLAVGPRVLNVDIIQDKVVFCWSQGKNDTSSRFECVAPMGVYDWERLEMILLQGVIPKEPGVS